MSNEDPIKEQKIDFPKEELRVVLAMLDRGDHQHDIAAWFGKNGGRVAEVENARRGRVTPVDKDGNYYEFPDPAPVDDLPPQGSPGKRALKLREAAKEASRLISENKPDQARHVLDEATTEYYNEDE